MGMFPTQRLCIAECQIKPVGNVFVHYLLLYGMFQDLCYMSVLNNNGFEIGRALVGICIDKHLAHVNLFITSVTI